MTDRRAGVTVTLEALLAARDRRVARRQQAFATQPATMVSVSVVMPGPVKNCGLSRHVQAEALSALDDLLAEHGWPATTLWAETAETGPEALIRVPAEARAVKLATIVLEEEHPLGRLWDIDVVTPEGAVSRRDLGFRPRRCFVCDRPAHECARSRAHSLDALLAVMEEKIDASLDGPRPNAS